MRRDGILNTKNATAAPAAGSRAGNDFAGRGTDPTAGSWRDEFPGLFDGVYLNTAAEGCGSRTLAAALERYAAAKMRGARGRETMLSTEAGCRARMAGLLGCAPAEIAFLSSTTEAINTVLLGLDWRRGDNVVLSDLEFPSSIVACLHLRERFGVEVRVARHAGGVVDAAALAEYVDDRTRLVLVSHVSFRSGYRVDLQAVAARAHEHGALLLVDAAQSLGAIRVDLDGVDFLAACTFKWLLGAHGLAVLYCRTNRLDDLRPPHLGWRSVEDYFSVLPDLNYSLQPDARRYEGGMLNYAGIYALHDALGLLDSVGPAEIERWVLRLSGRILAGLDRLGIGALTSHELERRAGIVAFETPQHEAIGRALDAAGIQAWCKEGRVRASTHFYSSDSDVDAFLRVLEETGVAASPGRPAASTRVRGRAGAGRGS